jgi:hypothetical protein
LQKVQESGGFGSVPDPGVMVSEFAALAEESFGQSVIAAVGFELVMELFWSIFSHVMK